jgi:hypothetical protein
MDAPRQKTGGRQAGTCNRNSLVIRLAAAAHAGDAVALLARLMADGENDTIRLAAARELLDRAGGRTVDSEAVARFERHEAAAHLPERSLDEILAEGF